MSAATAYALSDGSAPRSVESHAHRQAKRLLVKWLREAAAAAGHDGHADFCNLSWRVNRHRPHWGVWVEYPVLADGTGITTVWDEISENWRRRPPMRDELIERHLDPTCIIDIAIQHKGQIAFAIEVVHKHACDPRKIGFLRDRLTLLEIPAYWVLGQVDRPTVIPHEFFL